MSEPIVHSYQVEPQPNIQTSRDGIQHLMTEAQDARSSFVSIMNEKDPAYGQVLFILDSENFM